MTNYDIFLSYARNDDDNSSGWISQLQRMISSELNMQLGRPVNIFQDGRSIGAAQRWSDEIGTALASAQVLLCVCSPNYFASEYCRAELTLSILKEFQLGRSGSIVPVQFVPSNEYRRDSPDPLGRFLQGRQSTFDFSEYRYLDPSSSWSEIRYQVGQLCRQIVEILPPHTPRGELDQSDLNHFITEGFRAGNIDQLKDYLPDSLRAYVDSVLGSATVRPPNTASSSQQMANSARSDTTSAANKAAVGVGVALAGVAAAKLVSSVFGTAAPNEPTLSTGIIDSDSDPIAISVLERSQLLRGFNQTTPRQLFDVAGLHFRYFGSGSFSGARASFVGGLASSTGPVTEAVSKLGDASYIYLFADETTDRALAFNSHIWIIVGWSTADTIGSPIAALRTTLRADNIRNEMSHVFGAIRSGSPFVTDHCRKHLRI